MSFCLVVAGKSLALASAAFTLSWTHSVERTEWRETWMTTDRGLVLVEARVKGSGAGMEPGENARRVGDSWVWKPQTGPIPELVLASSGATLGGWQLCQASSCIRFGDIAGQPVRIGRCR